MDTDQACSVLIPGSISEYASINGHGGADFYCRDANGESTGPYSMICPTEDQILALVLTDPIPGQNINNRKAKCEAFTMHSSPAVISTAPRSSPRDGSVSRSRGRTASVPLIDLAQTVIEAGNAACVDNPRPVTADHTLEAYVTSLNGMRPVEALYISWYEIQPYNKFLKKVEKNDHLVISIPSSQAVYRACAYAPAGAGNLRLHISISS